jgi:hypothetical protein
MERKKEQFTRKLTSRSSILLKPHVPSCHPKKRLCGWVVRWREADVIPTPLSLVSKAAWSFWWHLALEEELWQRANLVSGPTDLLGRQILLLWGEWERLPIGFKVRMVSVEMKERNDLHLVSSSYVLVTPCVFPHLVFPTILWDNFFSFIPQLKFTPYIQYFFLFSSFFLSSGHKVIGADYRHGIWK